MLSSSRRLACLALALAGALGTGCERAHHDFDIPFRAVSLEHPGFIGGFGVWELYRHVALAHELDHAHA